ncbi:MAG: DUF1385 domain-containing protein [Candidatus Marinimicrobia bacterium]|nr:DUF1385 domain-containing protein [Candidatus Neomarinimicrobiota bacterium]
MIKLPRRLGRMPLVAGIGYKLLKLTARFQHITTQMPDDDQVTVALESLQAPFGERISEVAGRQFVAHAIA